MATLDEVNKRYGLCFGFVIETGSEIEGLLLF
jgi:hypothetical protein